jgi:hypothetical protein
MTQEIVEIGRRQENAFEAYIPRSVSTICLGINKLSEFCKITGSLVIICNFPQFCNSIMRLFDLHVMELDQYLKLEDRKQLSKVNVLLTSNKWQQVQFNDICKEAERNVHLLQDFDNISFTSVLSKQNRLSLETMKSKEARVHELEIFTYISRPSSECHLLPTRNG